MEVKKLSVNINKSVVDRLTSISNEHGLSLTNVIELFLEYSQGEYDKRKIEIKKQTPYKIKKVY